MYEMTCADKYILCVYMYIVLYWTVNSLYYYHYPFILSLLIFYEK